MTKRVCVGRTTGPHHGMGDIGPMKLGYWSDCLQIIDCPDDIGEGDLIRIIDGKVVRVVGEGILSVGIVFNENWESGPHGRDT